MLQEEMVLVMRLMGCSKISDIKRDMVITKDLSNHSAVHCFRSQHDANYQNMQSVMSVGSTLDEVDQRAAKVAELVLQNLERTEGENPRSITENNPRGF